MQVSFRAYIHTIIDVIILASTVVVLVWTGFNLKAEMLGEKWAQLALSQIAAKMLIMFSEEFVPFDDHAKNRAVGIRMAFALAVALAG